MQEILVPVRYRLEPGLHLVYELVSDLTGSISRSYAATFDVWVTRTTPSGAWRVVVELTYEVTAEDESVHTRTELAIASLTPDGSAVPDRGELRLVEAVFPLLPEPGETTWHVEHSTGYEYVCRMVADAPRDEFVFTMEERGAVAELYGTASINTVTIDRTRGVLASAENRFSRTRKFRFTGTDRQTLTSYSVDRGVAEAMEKDATIYCDMMDRMSNLKMRSRLDESKVDEIARLLDTYKDQFSTPVFQREIAGRCNRSPSLTEYERQRARTFAALLDRPAPEWKLPDLEGATHKLADYRDKVVVLDFWSLSCDWGSHAMSQMNELCAAVKDMPVAVLGIYKGNDREDAELVADKMKLAYPTLMGTEIKNNYGVSGGSTVVVIDQHGVLRKLHFGSSPTLKQELLEDINSLLN